MRSAVAAIVLLIGANVRAVPYEKSFLFKQTICQLGTHKAELQMRFHREIAPTENDYVGASMLFLKTEKKVHLLEDYSKDGHGDYDFILAKEASACKATQSFSLGEEFLAILYSRDNRPFQEMYRVAIWDVKKDRIVEKRELGAVTEFYKDPDGFLFATMIPRTEIEEVNMTSASGKKLKAVDKDLGALQVMKISHGQVKVEYDPIESYIKSNWRKFFKEKEDYLKAAGWNPKKKTFKNIIVYEATHFDSKEGPMRESCIAFASVRGGPIDNSNWHCIQEENLQ